MATTTPNYGWAVPTSTDLVKDGATAIETLGDAIDASMNTALGTKKAGMVLLNTTSFSAVASQSINDVFSATYANYLINFNALQNTSNGTIVFKYRTSGSDNSTTNYFFSITGLSTSGSDNLQAASDTQSYFVRGFAGGRVAANLNIYSPQLSQTTLSTSTASGTTGGGNQASYVGGSLFNATTVFDGISFITSAGTMTGTIRIYGYNN
jgi:hypothetical protein